MLKKDFFIGYFFFILVLSLVLVLQRYGYTLAQYVPVPDPIKFGNLPSPSGDTGTAKAMNLIKAAYQNTKYIIGAVAIGVITYAGFRMITAHGKEDVITEQKNLLTWAIIGLGLISIAEGVSKIFEFSNNATPIQNPETIAKRSLLFNENVQLVITFIKYIIGAVAVLFIVRAGGKLIVAGGSEEVINQEKKNLFLGIFGLIGIVMADTLVNEILYKVNPNVNYKSGVHPEIDAGRGIEEIVAITSFIVTWVGPLAILALIAGAIYYIVALGQDEKVDKARVIIFNALLGIIIIYGAYAIVSTFVGGSIDYQP